MPKSGTTRRTRGRPRSERPGQPVATVQTLDRALVLLGVLADADGLTLTDLSQRAGMSPATAYRMLTTMARRGFVANDQEQGLWRIGVETFRTGNAFARSTKVVDVGRPLMRRLTEGTGETANLAIEEEGEVVFISQVETHEPIRAFFRPGTRAPMHASGIGKALLAERTAREVRALLQRRGLQAFTPQTLVTPDTLVADLEAIRERGWALDDEERYQGMRCIAAAIYNHHGEAVAGVSVSGPTVRMADERLAEFAAEVKRAAAAITDAVGGVGPVR